jgi:hypothetical protein
LPGASGAAFAAAVAPGACATHTGSEPTCTGELAGAASRAPEEAEATAAASGSAVVAAPDAGLAVSGGDHFVPGSAACPSTFASAPFTGADCGSGVFGGVHTFGGFTAFVTASAEGIVTTDISTASAETAANRERRERTKSPARRDN